MSAAPVKRILPGLALRDGQGRVPFVKARVIYSSPRMIYVEAEHAEHKLIWLMGETYIYWCPRCHATVWEQEVMKQGGPFCLFCKTELSPVLKGDRVRLHFRHAPDGSWGNWWGEVWEY